MAYDTNWVRYDIVEEWVETTPSNILDESIIFNLLSTVDVTINFQNGTSKTVKLLQYPE